MQGLLLGIAVAIFGAQPSAGGALPGGTLIFLENCNSVVEYSTGQEVAHVALAFSDAGETWIYEATPAKVRRIGRSAYELELARLNKARKSSNQIRMLAVVPKKAYAPQELAAMRSYLDEQIGRRYSVKNYVREQPGDGVHCAELAAATLTESGRYDFTDGYALHPAALLDLVQPTHMTPREIELPAWKSEETWCQRADRRWGEVWRWCRWSCREVVSFCW